MRWLIAVALLVLVPTLSAAQERRPAPERSSEPNYGTAPDRNTGPGGQEVRPGSPEGDAPSASAGRVVRDSAPRRVLGLPVNAVVVIAAVILGLVALIGMVVPSARRRARARGHSTSGGR